MLPLFNKIMSYQNANNFQLIPSIEDENNPFVRLFCDRHLYIARRSTRNAICHDLNDYWSTYWLDIVFNSEIGNPLAEKHLLYTFDPPSPPTDVLETYFAIPSLLYKGYWELLGKRNELYFYAAVCDYGGGRLFVPYFIKMTDIEVVRLQERIAFNENCKRRAGIYEYLLQQY